MLRGLGSHPALRAYRVKLNSVLLEGIEFTALDALVLPESEFILSNPFNFPKMELGVLVRNC